MFSQDCRQNFDRGFKKNKKSNGPIDTGVESTPMKNEPRIEFRCLGKSQPIDYALFSHDDL